MHRPHFSPSKKSVLCGDHFEQSCFDKTGQIVRLRENSVPTIFTLPHHFMKSSKSQNKSHVCQLTTKTSTGQAASILQKAKPTPCIISSENILLDHIYATMESPRGLKRKYDSICDKLVTARKEVKCKRQNVKRLEKRVSSLTTVVDNRKKKHLFSESCEAILRSTFSGVPLEIMNRIFYQKKKSLEHLIPKL